MIGSPEIVQDLVLLKKQIRAVDLSLSAARKRQSPRTRFVHYFSQDESVSDTIPLFENFCFALALFRQKTAETVLEGKELIDRLLLFQAPNGNFPVYLHDYPRCWDFLMPLKIAPALVQILRHFGSVLNFEIKEKIESSLKKSFEFIEKQTLPPLWEYRYHCLLGRPSSFVPVTAEEWFETLVSDQLITSSAPTREIPYHANLQMFIDDLVVQEKGEPRPLPIEWASAEAQGYQDRLLRDHPHQIYSSLLFPISLPEKEEASIVFRPSRKGGINLLWGGSKLHSFTTSLGKVIELGKSGAKIHFDLEGEPQWGREDLFEVLCFCDLSSETEIFIEKRRGTVFSLGEKLLIQTPRLQIEASFTLIEGSGDFSGQISRANRSSQIACQKNLLYEVFDWQIGLRTLRRSSPCKIQLEMKFHSS